ncbi:hypothetical protein CROQUDRAFT_102231 [Cronartium quercuum f. sp. fusiforme G11]|uniref:Uncharacterized protein n=1 Tax=Cronartium quercuum f. sp. fusiforme G11 TaxID=708437 RepID=A0A9P6N7X8_9BASI|nr:hypothetical protein CROQUDRAFT_102231 [Cronartium quercuum f. sp. fusiforme G11]
MFYILLLYLNCSPLCTVVSGSTTRPWHIQVITLLNFNPLTHHTQMDSVRTHPRYMN